MIVDTNLTLCVATALNAVAGTATIPNVIDLGAAARNPFAGHTLYAAINVNTAFLSAGAATVEFRFVTDGQDPMLTDGTATFHGTTGPLTMARLAVGARYIVSLNRLGPDTERFLGLNVVTAVATTTAGAVSIHIISDESAATSWRAYADAVN